MHEVWRRVCLKLNLCQSLCKTRRVTLRPSLKRLWHPSAAAITLYGEASHSPKLFTKLTVKFHI